MRFVVSPRTTAENQNAVNEDEPTKVIDIGPLWSVALDRAQELIEEAEKRTASLTRRANRIHNKPKPGKPLPQKSKPRHRRHHIRRDTAKDQAARSETPFTPECLAQWAQQ